MAEWCDGCDIISVDWYRMPTQCLCQHKSSLPLTTPPLCCYTMCWHKNLCALGVTSLYSKCHATSQFGVRGLWICKCSCNTTVWMRKRHLKTCLSLSMLAYCVLNHWLKSNIQVCTHWNSGRTPCWILQYIVMIESCFTIFSDDLKIYCPMPMADEFLCSIRIYLYWWRFSLP